MFKLLGINLVVVALVIAFLPEATDCDNPDLSGIPVEATSVTMRCHATARAEIAIGAPLILVGGLMYFGRRKENLRNLSLFGFTLGVFAMLLPTYLIGVCPDPAMLCNNVMRPALLFSGGIVGLVSITAGFIAQRRYELAL
jgi:hypothetical protein